MMLSTIKLLIASFAVTSFAIAGCAADTSASNDGDGEDADVTADELSARSAQFVGSYNWSASDSGAFVDFKQLTLKANGTFTASTDASLVNPAVRCIAFPCTIGESGTWTTVKSGGQLKLKVDPTGVKPSRSYTVALDAQTLTLSLTRYGQTTQLFSTATTCANVRCGGGMHCEMKGINGGAVPVCVTISPPPLKVCKTTGCSGQICAEDDVITTCEARAVYACYHAATCERQADGSCDFTPTPALKACIASH